MTAEVTKKLQDGERRGSMLHFGEGNGAWACSDVLFVDDDSNGPRILAEFLCDPRMCTNDDAVRKLLSIRRFYRQKKGCWP